MIGRRRADLPLARLHDDLQPGDYWKISDRSSSDASNLEGTCWYVVAPGADDGTGYMIGRLEAHTVREHDDGTISVRPNDGSSNSIKISGAHGRTWHGYIDHGVWNQLPD